MLRFPPTFPDHVAGGEFLNHFRVHVYNVKLVYFIECRTRASLECLMNAFLRSLRNIYFTSYEYAIECPTTARLCPRVITYYAYKMYTQ